MKQYLFIKNYEKHFKKLDQFNEKETLKYFESSKAMYKGVELAGFKLIKRPP